MITRRTTSPEPLVYSIPDIVARTPFDRTRINQAVCSGALVASQAKKGAKWLIRPRDLDRWIDAGCPAYPMSA